MALRPNIAAGQNRAQSETGLDRLSLKCPFSQMMAIGFYGTYRDKLPYNPYRSPRVGGDKFVTKFGEIFDNNFSDSLPFSPKLVTKISPKNPIFSTPRNH